MKPRRLHLAIAAVATAGLTILGGTAASAFWTSSAATNAAAQADALTQGATPTTSLSGATVTVTFAAATTTQGHVAATGYVVRRYNAASGGSGTTLSCTASPCTDTPGAGTWYYTDTPLLATNWQGPESARSAGQAVAYGPAAKLAFTQQPSSPTAPNTAFATQPAVTVEDSAGNTVSSATTAVTVALSSPGGATLSCTANPTNAVSGVATFAGCKVDKAGTYTLTATASGLTSATSNSFTISTPAPISPTALVLANKSNGGSPGQIESGDTITVSFSAGLAVNSLCSAWSGDTQNQSNSTADVLITTPGKNVAGNNILSIASWTACGSFHVGSIDLGSAQYLTTSANSLKSVDFGNSTVAYNAAAHSITITLGTFHPSSTTALGTVASSVATLTVDSGLTGTAGQAISPNSIATGNVQQF